ncbi:MAG: SusD/RagB family nutrient-binding outer membrane lipoprotein [Tannerella sp.]|jgi:hypothetical protein|nr:SusD/RagB family nutrient-binding outer membrane lipoprotein [Tannerella sp.]
MKKIMNKWVVSLFMATLMSSCTGDFYDINTDPDALSDVPHTNVLGNVLRRTAERMGDDLDGFGTWAGYISKIQYPDNMSGANPENNTYGNRWANCYWGNEQLRVILAKTEALAEGNKNLRWACRIFSIQLWLFNIDMYGDMPYSEAFKGAPDLGGITTSKYDSEKDIYPDLIAKLKVIGDEMATGFGSDNIGPGDFLFKGNVEKWQRYCNSLRLRAAMRISGVWPAAKTHIEEIAGNPGRYPLLDSNANNGHFYWNTTSPYWDRWYENFRGRDDHGLFDTFVDHLKKMEDPRIQAIVKPAPSDGEYRGYVNGGPTATPLNHFSRIGVLYRETPGHYTAFYKPCETFFILAEAAMKGMNVGMSAQEAYEKAVRMSMEDNKISVEETEAYLAGKGKWDNTIERIWWDQWVALFKENMEAWCLYRRTGIPTPDLNYISIRSVWGNAHTSQPFRAPYPANQQLYNKDNYNTANVGIVDYVWGKQLWWDTRSGVK